MKIKKIIPYGFKTLDKKIRSLNLNENEQIKFLEFLDNELEGVIPYINKQSVDHFPEEEINVIQDKVKNLLARLNNVQKRRCQIVAKHIAVEKIINNASSEKGEVGYNLLFNPK
jgi:hypothetical protein